MANIIRFDPFEDLTRLQREMNRMFDDSYRANPRNAEQGGQIRTWAPAVDITEDADKITLKAELPGIKQEDIDIEIHGDTLTLRGERKLEESVTKGNYVRVERAYGSFQRAFSLNAPIQEDKVNASYKDGVLVIELPKSEAVKPKKVSVTAS